MSKSSWKNKELEYPRKIQEQIMVQIMALELGIAPVTSVGDLSTLPVAARRKYRKLWRKIVMGLIKSSGDSVGVAARFLGPRTPYVSELRKRLVIDYFTKKVKKNLNKSK